MPISDADAMNFGFLALYAEDMYDPGSTVPHDEPRIGAAGYDVVARLIAVDAYLPPQSDAAAGIPKSIQPSQTVFYGYLAKNRADSTSFVVAIRGTNGFAEWVIDADFFPRDCPLAQGTKVEQGFWSIYASMMLCDLAGAQIGANAAEGIANVVGAGAVTIVGHSLGSALATYLSFDVAKRLGARASACMFASPRTGDQAWANAYETTVANYRLINYVLDVVPYVPFDAPPIQYSTLSQVTILQPSTAEAEVRFDPVCDHHLVCYCAMIDYGDAKKRIDPKDFAAWQCVLGAPSFSLNYELIKSLAFAANELGGAARGIVRLLTATARAKGGHV